MDRKDIKMLVSKWWDIYNDASLDLRAGETIVQAEDQTVSRSSIMALPNPAISYVPAPTAA